MKTYKCLEQCYADDHHLYREGDERRVEDNYNHPTLDVKFELISADKPLKVKAAKADPEHDLMAGVKEFAKENKITVAEQKKIYIAAGAVDSNEKMKALVDFIEE